MRVEVQTVDPLDAKLHKFWQIEEAESAEDNSVINQFTKDIYHDGTRYVAKLPFKPDHESVPDNFSTCVKRLESLNSRLDRLGINADYEKIFIDYEKDGIIERVPEAQIAKEEGTVHYIPHRPVIREDKVTTKIRPVFDASCSVNGVSLNDCLYPGPNLLAKIFDILLRFRMNKIGILADIKQAFLNISIHPDHRDFLRFLWRDPSSSDREIVVYRFLRVVFGLTSSPFLLNGTIRQHMSKYLESDKAFVEQFLSDLYVDDITTGTDTVESGKIFCEKALSSMSDAGLQLRKWTSNDAELQEFSHLKNHRYNPSVLKMIALLLNPNFNLRMNAKGYLVLSGIFPKMYLSLGLIHFWKRVALCWIKGNRKTWKPWVENRVVSARKVVQKEDWHHIPGKDNPADIPTRMVPQFKDAFSFFFLSNESSLLDTDKSDVLSEARNRFVDFDGRSSYDPFECKDEVLSSVSFLFTTDKSDNDIGLSKIIDVGRYSTLQKLIKVTALVYRFVSNIKAKRNNGHVIKDVISSEEQEAALTNWIKEEQRLMKSIPTYRKLTKSLGVFEGDDLLRVRGRFDNADITPDQKHPILIRNATSPFTKLVIWNSHERTKHQGIDSTLADVRRRYWIVQGRKAVKNTIRQCVVCIRFQGRTLRSPPTPDLPDFRVDFHERSFNSVGMDFAGPLYFRNFLDNDKTKKDSLKCYILLLTCATSRAVHLELVPDLSKESFIRAFKRFVARRGTPSLVISDNAKTFRSSTVKRFMTSLNIKQRFILPASPWWGGFYERLVRSVKSSLKRF
ncbi:uncharacterized protein [Clytia hemisphaerica]|uniref:uncharacterized protein n=1 Tax=Clytia hemisphaerica TaxID=252671 RepID=UPI0034D78514